MGDLLRAGDGDLGLPHGQCPGDTALAGAEAPDGVVAQGEQRFVRRWRFVGEDVADVAEQFARVQGSDDGGAVGDRAACHVENQRLALAQGEGVGVEQVKRGVVERAMQADDVGAGENLIKRRVIRRTRRGATALRPQYFHAEGARDFRYPPSDVAGADDAERLPGEVDNRQFIEAEAAIALPVAVNHRLMVGNEAAQRGENDGEGMLGDGGGRIAGDVGELHAVRLARLGIHVIDAGGGDLNQLEFGRLGDDVARQQHLVTDGNLRATQTLNHGGGVVRRGIKHLPVADAFRRGQVDGR